MEQKYDENLKLGFREKMRVLLPYLRDKILEQIKCIWFIVFCLILFQRFVLGLPIVYASMIGVGMGFVVLGLAFFMEGLRLGLMPLGEIVGSVLPRRFGLIRTLLFSFIVGVAATIAEPAIFVLKEVGRGVSPLQAPLLYSLLNDYTEQLVLCVGTGVGAAVALGTLRFFKGWSLKPFIYASVIILSALTLLAYGGPSFWGLPPMSEVVRPILGLAWDCGAITTGPVTVPIILALGIGVCRIVSSDDDNAGFGIVTLASLFPILAVLCLSFYHYLANDYYGADNYPVAFHDAAQAKITEIETVLPSSVSEGSGQYSMAFSADDFDEFLATGKLKGEHEVLYQGGEAELVDGKIIQTNGQMVFKRVGSLEAEPIAQSSWKEDVIWLSIFTKSLANAAWAIFLLCSILLVVLVIFLRERPRFWDEIFIGLACSVIGMALFLLGIGVGLIPLGEQVGHNIPATFTTIIPWEMKGLQGPIIAEGFLGKTVAVIFAFILGYGATLAEPALNALGTTVEKLTVGAFKKNLLMHSVATGVGLGLAVGILKLAYDLELTYLLIIPYLLLVFMTALSSEEFVNLAWDSAGVTTGPITVPLVIAMGLGIGATSGVTDGFGVLALASIGPIISVLTVGLIVTRKAKRLAAKQAASMEVAS